MGYLTVPIKQVGAVMKLSGKGKVFVPQLCKDVSEMHAVAWLKVESDENKTEYFQRIPKQADALGVPMAWRNGGGKFLGLLKDLNRKIALGCGRPGDFQAAGVL